MKECPRCRRCFADQVNHCPTDGDPLKFTIVGEPLLDGRYQLESRLGQGGMGLVYRARHIFLKTQHAVKIILPDLVGNDPTLVTRFRQEAMAAAAIRHPNIVAVTDFGVVGGTMPFLVMEFIQGESLNDILQKEERLSPERSLEIIQGVCAGLGAAHRQGIIHRDLKPLNIMIRDDAGSVSENIKLLDFGLAKIKSGELLGSFVAAQTTGLMGSPFYMAPEQWGEEEPDRRADIYSLGIILYQMLAGEVPYKGTSIPSIMKKHLTGEPPALVTMNLGISPEVERVVHKALAKDPDTRPQTVEEFVRELRYAVTGSEGPVTGGFSRPLGVDTMRIGGVDQAMGENFGGTMPLTGGGVARDTVYGGQRTEAQMPPPDARDARHTMPINAVPGADTGGQDAWGGNQSRGRDTVYTPNETAYNPAQAQGPRDAAAEMLPRFGQGEQPPPPQTSAAETLVIEPEAMRLKREEELREHARREEEQRRLEEEEWRRREAAEQNSFGGQPPQHSGQQTGTGQFGFTQDVAPQHAGQQSAQHQQFAQQQYAASGQQSAPTIEVQKQGKSRAPLIAVVGVVAVLVLGGIAVLAYMLVKSRGEGNTNNSNANVENFNAGNNTNNSNKANGTGQTIKADLVELPGGSFRAGLEEVPPFTDSYSPTFLQWMYAQWPAHPVTVKPFSIDRTEVTNAEYAQFVAATGYPPPPGIWDGNQPKPGQELWPVRNVTLEDAQRFAIWRSKRDSTESTKVTYRLPTEDEWEYAARGGGDAARVYPWGKEWSAGRANLDSDNPTPVGSHTEGRTPQGVEDMIGNVWEWTSTEATMYPGNNKLKLPPENQGWIVVRGGSYQSNAAGDRLITSTTRMWQPKDKRDPVIGFRLVREGGATADADQQ